MSRGPIDPRQLGFYLALAQLGMEMVVPIVAGLFLDHYLGWSPWGVVVGAVFGFVGSLMHLVALLKRFEDKKDKEDGGETRK